MLCSPERNASIHFSFEHSPFTLILLFELVLCYLIYLILGLRFVCQVFYEVLIYRVMSFNSDVNDE